MTPGDVHEQIRLAAESIADRAPDYFATAQREVLARTFVPALRQVREGRVIAIEHEEEGDLTPAATGDQVDVQIPVKK